MAKGLLMVISGFSGAGKGTIVNHLLEKYPEDYCISVSATTRSPREGEVDGKHYFFKTREEFEQLIAEDGLLEYAEYVNNYYGTPKDYVKQQMAANINVILEIEIQGALKIKEMFPEAVLIFIVTPSAKVLKERLTGRGTETEEVINGRLKRAVEEADECAVYDYIVVNDKIEDAVDTVDEIIKSEQKKLKHNRDFLSNFKEELKSL